jgi:hypothetical protein
MTGKKKREDKVKKAAKKVTVRKYGLLRPLNWGSDCADHLFLMTKFWNTLVEIERDTRDRYRAIVNSDQAVAEINQKIADNNALIAEQDSLRKQARKTYRAKKGDHTAPFDDKIKEIKEQNKALAPKAKKLRQLARIQARDALAQLEPERKQAVKKAYNESGLWWGNYNTVLDSYNTARVRAMKTGTELKFHRFDGSGRFHCQLQGGITTEDLLNGREPSIQLRMIDQDDFARLLGHTKSKQSYGSRNYERGYGVLAITIYTGKNENGKLQRRMLEFPIILHRPLPTDALLKDVEVTRKRIGTDMRYDVVFTFTSLAEPVVHPFPEAACGINLGWKAVAGGLRVATLFDGKSREHLVLPQVIVDKFAYVEQLRSEIDTMTNENFAWLLGQIPENIPEVLADVVATFKRVKRPHPGKFAKMVNAWRQQSEDFLPEVLEQAEGRLANCFRKEREHHHLRDKLLRRREDFYANQAKRLAETYGQIALDTIDLQRLAELENNQGEPNELHQKARHQRTLAAVSVFRDWLKKQAAKTGALVNELTIKSTSTCHACQADVSAGSGYVRTCLSCGKSFDEDENAAINLHREMVANL